MIIYIHGTENKKQSILKGEWKMYRCIEIGKENIVVEDEDAWVFAILHCFDAEMIDNFLLEFGEEIFTNLNTGNIDEFKSDVVEWFFSGMWIHEGEEDEDGLLDNDDDYDPNELVDWFNRHRLV